MDRSGHGSGQKRRGAGEEEDMSGRGGFMRRRSDDERVHDVRNVYLGLNAEGKRNSGFVAQNRVVGPPTGSTLPTAGTTGLTTEVAKLKEQVSFLTNMKYKGDIKLKSSIGMFLCCFYLTF